MTDTQARLLEDDAPRLVFDTIAGERFAAELRVHDAAECALPERRTPSSPTRCRLLGLKQRGRWLEALADENGGGHLGGDASGEFLLKQGRSISAAGSVQTTMDIFSSVAHVGVHLPIFRPSEHPTLDPNLVPHFSYRDPRIMGSNENEAPTRRQRFYGVHVGGLGDNKTIQSVLDSSLAVLSLLDDGTEQKFQLQAGGEIYLRGASVSSRLVPKENRTESGNRILDIPVDGMTLRIDGREAIASESPITLDTRHSPQLQFLRPLLLSPPTGTSSHERSRTLALRTNGKLFDSPEFVRWTLARSDGDTMAVNAGGGKVFADEGDAWSEPFATTGQKEFDLTDLPGIKVTIDDTTRLRGLARNVVERTSITQVLLDGEKRPHYKDVLFHFNFGEQDISKYAAFNVIPQDAVVLASELTASAPPSSSTRCPI